MSIGIMSRSGTGREIDRHDRTPVGKANVRGMDLPEMFIRFACSSLEKWTKCVAKDFSFPACHPEQPKNPSTTQDDRPGVSRIHLYGIFEKMLDKTIL